MSEYVLLERGMVGTLLEVKAKQKKWGWDRWTIRKLGPEVKEPDYTLLVDWANEHALHEGKGCGVNYDRDCTCGLAEALKAAGIE